MQLVAWFCDGSTWLKLAIVFLKPHFHWPLSLTASCRGQVLEMLVLKLCGDCSCEDLNILIFCTQEFNHGSSDHFIHSHVLLELEILGAYSCVQSVAWFCDGSRVY